MNLDKPFIIAEAGTCHAVSNLAMARATRQEHSRLRAIHYVNAAAGAGADAVKFQIFDNPIKENLFCWIKGDEVRNLRWIDSRMSLDDWKFVKDYCSSQGIVFLASVFEYETVKWLTELKVEATKVASRAAQYLNEFKDAPQPLLISNGMFDIVPEDDIVLECEANYPSTARWRGKYPGFSDHSGTPWRAIDALARGCKLIEVHFFVDPNDAGPDLPASLTVEELKLVCEARDGMMDIRN